MLILHYPEKEEKIEKITGSRRDKEMKGEHRGISLFSPKKRTVLNGSI